MKRACFIRSGFSLGGFPHYIDRKQRKIGFVIANGDTSYVTHGGDAWGKLTDVNGNKILKCFKGSVLNTNYPVNLLCVSGMLKNKHGDMSNHDIDFKRDVVIYNEGLSNEARVKIHEVEGLPTMKIEPLTQSEKTKLMNRLAKPGMQASMYLHLRKLTWQTLHDRLGHPSDVYLKVLVKYDMLLGLRDLGAFPTHGVKDLFMDIGGPWPV